MLPSWCSSWVSQLLDRNIYRYPGPVADDSTSWRSHTSPNSATPEAPGSKARRSQKGLVAAYSAADWQVFLKWRLSAGRGRPCLFNSPNSHWYSKSKIPNLLFLLKLLRPNNRGTPKLKSLIVQRKKSRVSRLLLRPSGLVQVATPFLGFSLRMWRPHSMAFPIICSTPCPHTCLR